WGAGPPPPPTERNGCWRAWKNEPGPPAAAAVAAREAHTAVPTASKYPALSFLPAVLVIPRRIFPRRIFFAFSSGSALSGYKPNPTSHEKYNTAVLATRDHGTRDHGTRDHGTRDHGTRDHGTRDHGTRGHGSEPLEKDRKERERRGRSSTRGPAERKTTPEPSSG
ncbi:MAG: hypothetical protein BJ554DRAFT_5109, partial [Olpidium bornovanus]